MAYDGTLKFDTKLDTDGFQSGINSISSIALKGVKATATILAGTTAAIGAIGAASIKVGSDFESGMSAVSAISGATGDELEALTEKAKEMGSTTKFSATESASAFEYMAMAGWKTEDMLGGIEGIMNLAAASGEELATTSDIVTDALTAFGMSANDSSRFADVLAAASSNANTNVSMLGESFKYVAPVAGALGYSAEDTAVALGLMANAGIKASQAGTSLRSMMSRLSNPTNDVQGAMDELGISLTNTDGSMKSLDEMMGDLRKGFADLSESEQAQVASTLAGQEAMSGLLAIVNASDSDFDKLKNSIYDCDGAAAQMAETMNDNLQGQITILKSGLEGLGIELYEEMQKPLQGIVEEAQIMVSDLQDAFLKDGFKGLAGKVGDILADVIVEMAEATPEMVEYAVYLCESFIQSIEDNKEDIAKAGADIVTTLAGGVLELTGSMWSVGIDLLAELLKGLASDSESIGIKAGEAIAILAESLKNNGPVIVQAGKDIITGFLDGLSQEFPQISAVISGFFEGFTETLAPIIEGVVDGVSQVLSALGEADPESLESVGKALGTIAAAIVLLNGAGKVAAGVSILVKVLGALKNLGIVSVVAKIVEGFALWSGKAGTLGEVIACQFPKIAALGGKIGSMASTVAGFFSKLVAFGSSAMSSIGSFFATFGTVIAGVGSIIGGVVLAATNFIDMFKNGFNIVKDILMGVGIALAAVGAVIVGAPALVAGIVAGIVYAIANMVILIKEHWNVIIEFFAGLPTTIGAVIDSIAQFFQDLPYKIGYAIGYAIGILVQWGMNLYNWAVTNVPLIVDSIAGFFSALPGKIGAWFTGVINGAIAWGLNLYNWAMTTIPPIIDSIANYFATLPSKIWLWLVNTILKVQQWAINLKQKGIEAATALVNAVVEGVSGLPAKMREVGANIVNGVWEGIQSAKAKFMADVKSFFSGIIAGAKAALDINSPSGEAKRKVGKWIPRGVGEGMEDEMPALYQQAENEMAELANRMQAAVDVETGNINVKSKAQSEYKASTEVPQVGDTYVEEKFEQNNTYNTPVATPSEVAKAQREAARNLLGGVK